MERDDRVRFREELADAKQRWLALEQAVSEQLQVIAVTQLVCRETVRLRSEILRRAGGRKRRHSAGYPAALKQHVVAPSDRVDVIAERSSRRLRGGAENKTPSRGAGAEGAKSGTVVRVRRMGRRARVYGARFLAK